MRKILIILFYALGFNSISGQVYTDFIGAGNSSGIKVSTSSNYESSLADYVASGNQTINGSGMDAKMMDAARFLSQATFGADEDLVRQVSKMDFEEWIDAQFEITPTHILPEMISTYDLAFQIYLENGGTASNYFSRPVWEHFDYAWWQINLTSDDILRQRIAYTLSEILVISMESDLKDKGEALADYYDMLLDLSFGNYRDLLLAVTLHPSMGVYLSHMNNSKAIPEKNIHPDENYAREIMQLFSIGLFELNLDGTKKKDTNGLYIPTYNNADIKEFAKVFTGLSGGGSISKNDQNKANFNMNINNVDYTVPMKMYQEFHETTEKKLLNGFVISAGQQGMTDIEQAVNHLFNHPNVGPFISRQLIQRLVKSNPTPEYIARVAGIFNNNGMGVRGDMKSIIKAILLDPEARSCEWVNNIDQGRLREPITRYTQFAKIVGYRNQYELFWNNGSTYMESAGQHPLHSYTVFNFYLPDFQPNGPISQKNLVAPEFQIHNTRNSVGYVNSVNEWTFNEKLLYTSQYNPSYTWTTFNKLLPFARDPDGLINKLDILLTHGQLSEETRNTIRESIKGFSNSLVGDYNRLKLALYIVMISPDYCVMK